MKIVLSPAKSLDYTTPAVGVPATLPMFAGQVLQLVDIMRGHDAAALQRLMSISPALAAENEARYQRFSAHYDDENSRPALFAFNGDVYDGLAAREFTLEQARCANERVRILSGLYGLLRPFDRMQPYRLEMGTRLPNPAGKDLYAFWRSLVTEQLNRELDQDAFPVLVNLASDEYFGVIDQQALRHPVLKIAFEEWRDDARAPEGGKWKVVSFNAKRARGMMTRYAVERGSDDPAVLRDFDRDGYALDTAVSTDSRWVFRRRDWPPA